MRLSKFQSLYASLWIYLHLHFLVSCGQITTTKVQKNKEVFSGYVIKNFTNGQNAANVLGQNNFTDNIRATNIQGGGGVVGVEYDFTNKRLFAMDYNNTRVLVYDLSSGVSDGQNAVYVLGQSNFTSSNSPRPPTASSLLFPYYASYDSIHQRLFVADSGNNRVLVYDLSNGITNGINASYVLGQANFTSYVSSVSQNTFSSPIGVEYDSSENRLFVFDGNRILVFDLSGGISNGMNASYVLGQANFTTNNAAVSQTGLNNSEGNLFYDTTQKLLFVADGGNCRVQIYDLSSGITNNMPAAYVLGQEDFDNNLLVDPPNQSSISYPSDVLFDSNSKRLFVSSYDNRALIFDLTNGITNNMDASNILGQYNFNTNTSNISQSELSNPYGLAFDSLLQKLFIGEYGNPRIMVFQAE